MNIGTNPAVLAITGTTAQSSDAKRYAAVHAQAQDFEASFVTSMLESMYAGMKPDKMFGGGQAEGMYRSMMNQEYGKAIAKTGTLGIADAIQREMLRLQEKHS